MKNDNLQILWENLHKINIGWEGFPRPITNFMYTWSILGSIANGGLQQILYENDKDELAFAYLRFRDMELINQSNILGQFLELYNEQCEDNDYHDEEVIDNFIDSNEAIIDDMNNRFPRYSKDDEQRILNYIKRNEKAFLNYIDINNLY